jgi:hypothetical protein
MNIAIDDTTKYSRLVASLTADFARADAAATAAETEAAPYVSFAANLRAKANAVQADLAAAQASLAAAVAATNADKPDNT